MKQFLSLLFVFAVCFSFACHKKTEIQLPGTSDAVPPVSSEPTPPELTQDKELNAVEFDELTRKFQPVFFDFNKFDIRNDQVQALTTNAGLLRSYATVNVILEGHCDERGTEEYNLALGERRARAVKQYLVDLGIDANRIQTVSYGESKPFAEGHSETIWQQNRRAQSVILKKQ